MRFLSMWQEDDGKWSFSRISSTIVLASWVAWVSFIVFNTKTLPSGMWEVSTVVGALYSLNKIASAVTDVKAAPPTPVASSGNSSGSESPLH